jgi:hypothetical protein
MSQDILYTQPIDDPIGSYSDIDGKCYIKTATDSGVINKPMLDDNNRLITTGGDLVSCNTLPQYRFSGEGFHWKRRTFFNREPGRSLYQKFASIDELTGHMDYGSGNPKWEIAYDLGIPASSIPFSYGSNFPANGPSDDPNSFPGWGIQINCPPGGGYIDIIPTSIFRGFDEIRLWVDMSPRYRNFYAYAAYVYVQHAYTGVWHFVTYWSGGKFNQKWQAITGNRGGNPNGRAHHYGWYGMLTNWINEGPGKWLTIPYKFHNMPISAVRIQHRRWSRGRTSMIINSLQFYRKGKKVDWLNLRQVPLKIC